MVDCNYETKKLSSRKRVQRSRHVMRELPISTWGWDRICVSGLLALLLSPLTRIKTETYFYVWSSSEALGTFSRISLIIFLIPLLSMGLSGMTRISGTSK